MGRARAIGTHAAFIVLAAVASGCGAIDAPSKAARAIRDRVPRMRDVDCGARASHAWSCTGRLGGRYQECRVLDRVVRRGTVYCEPAAYVWTAADALERCRSIGTKRYRLSRVRARRMPCAAARAAAQSYADTGAGGRTLGRIGANGLRCLARRLRRRPLDMRVVCSTDAVRERHVPASRVAFVVRDR